VATYAIGDIQGCFGALQRLLDAIGFTPGRDRLWLVGDLVNRGPRSLEVLRWCRAHDASVTAVLGNHDLHLLAIAHGVRKAKRLDALAPVLAAPDRDELIDWLRRRPLMHVDGRLAMVHAGLHPSWTVVRAAALAREVEAALRGDDPTPALAALYRKGDPQWSEDARGDDRLRAIAATLTRMRVCRADGFADFGFSAAPSALARGYLPWFEVPGRRSRSHTIIVGHWSTLGLLIEPGVIALDTGCAWGRSLTAICLEDRVITEVSARP
jgi:bis(5'-nucleosyl)-tetraphosphatase (symmetrical)